MNRLDFWREWELSYRVVFKVLAGLMSIVMATVLIIHVSGWSYFFDWQTTAYLQEVLYPVHSNHSELLESTVNTEISLIFQKVSGSYELLSSWMIFLFFGVVYVALMGVLTVVTYVKRFWFIVCMGLFIMLLAGAGFGRLGFLGLKDELAVGAVSLFFVPLAYYFNSFGIQKSIVQRFLCFVSMMCMVLTLIFFTSSLKEPLLHLAYFSYWPALVVSIVFILVIGHEIVYAILVLTTQGEGVKSSGNAIHFIVFSFVYLLNVGMVYLRNIGYINWDLYYISPMLLLSVSVVLGIWGLKGREVLYGKTLKFYPYAFLFYAGLAIICFSSILFFQINGNDSALYVIEEAVIFGHIAFGGMFFLYIITNFITLLFKNLPIYKIAFKEDNFPYVTSRLAGFIVVTALFLASGNAPLSQAVTGYFNGLADLNLHLDKTEAAKTYYLYGATYGNSLGQSNGSHKSNYMLGILGESPEQSIPILTNSIQRMPSEFAYASLGYAYEEDNRFFDALFTYQRGLNLFPKSWAIRNNLALLYNKTNVTDSILFYLNGADATTWQNSLTNANIAAVATMRDLLLDEVLERDQIENANRLGFQNNLLGYQVYRGDLESSVDPSPLQSTILHLYSFSFLKNLGIACALNGDKTYLKIVDQFLDEPRNGDYHRDLRLVKSLNLYRQGFVTSAFELMKNMATDVNENDGLIHALLGKWCIELGMPLQASKYFELARESGFAWSCADLAQMYAILGKRSIGQFILQKEIEKLDSTRLDAKTALVILDSVVATSTINWSNAYQFQSEQEDLKQLLELAKGENKGNIAAEFEVLGMRNPFFEEGVLAAVTYFKTVKKDENTSYSILLNAITINEYSANLIKSYIDQCFAMGLTNYAEGTILRLYDILSLKEFQAYEMEFEEKKASANLESW